MKKYIVRIIFLILIVLNSLVIFGFSAQNGESSGSISKNIIIKIADIIKINEDNREEFIEKGEKVIRKLAHFGIYTSLGLWSMAFISTFNIKMKKQVIGTTIWGVMYATTDEIHQLFINGRNGSALDVLLDTTGVIFGSIIVLLITNCYKLLKFNIEK